MKTSDGDPVDLVIHYIETWLATNEGNQKAVAPLTDLLELYRWIKETLKLMPRDVSATFDRASFNDEVNQVYDMLSARIPQMPEVQQAYLLATSGSSTGITSNLLLGIAAAITRENDQRWLSERYESLAEMQKRQQMLQRNREMIQKLNDRNTNKPDLLEEFDLVLDKAFYYRGTELDKNVSAGIAMRNLLDHYKGKVEAIAREHPKDNMTFEKALLSLSIYPKGTIMNSILLKELKTWSHLQARLSDLAKNRTRSDLKRSAVELFAHIYIVLTLIKI